MWYGSSAYSVGPEVSQIQKEIMTNGPVEGSFTVYADFPSYKSGEYYLLKSCPSVSFEPLVCSRENNVCFWNAAVSRYRRLKNNYNSTKITKFFCSMQSLVK